MAIFEYGLAVAVVVAGVVLSSFVDRSHRFPLALGVTVFWLGLGRFNDLPVAALARASSGFAFALLGLVSLSELRFFRSPRRAVRLPRQVLLYPFAGFVALAMIAGATDFAEASALWFTWILMSFSTLIAARTIVDQAALVRVLGGILLGIGGLTIVVLTAYALDSQSVLSGARFRPLGANPNQAAEIWVLGAPIAFYLATLGRRRGVRSGLALFGSLCVLLVFLSLSRAAIAVLVVAAFPLLRSIVADFRKAVVVAMLMVLIGSAAASQIDNLQVERLTLGVGEVRSDVIGSYVDAILERPIAGLGWTEGESARVLDEVGLGAHNSYLQILYVGGLMLAIPLFTLILVSLRCAARLRRRWPEAFDPMAVRMMTSLLFAIYFHGLLAGRIYHPTFVEAFVHVLAATFLISHGSPSRGTPRSGLSGAYSARGATRRG